MMHKPSGKDAVVVLLVDDDDGDLELTKRAMASWDHKVDLRVARDGEEALDYLLRRGDFSDPESSPRPDLVFLDLNMPKIDGRRVLVELRGRPALSAVPVVIMTTSEATGEILVNYEMGANSYIIKPTDPDEFERKLKAVESFWFDVAALPPDPDF